MKGPKAEKKICGYRIQRRLGSGAMGKVYKVFVPELKKAMALKLFSPVKPLVKKTGMKALEVQFSREAEMIAKLEHPNIVKVWNRKTKGSEQYYIMEYYVRNLGRLMGEGYWADRRTRVMLWDHAGRLMLQVLDGLRCLHDAGIVHRDIKPFNIALSETGTVKIVDFGLSKRRGEISAMAEKNLEIGTIPYAAPEQLCEPHKADARADLYAAGVMLHRMVTGFFPDNAFSWQSMVAPDVEKSWEDFLKKATAKDAAQRFQNAQKMQDALETVLRDYNNAKENVCSSPGQLLEPDIFEKRSGTTPLRNQPEQILARHAKNRFGLNELHQPENRFHNQFKRFEQGVILDQTTGLLWQQAGSAQALTWLDAHAYVNALPKLRAGSDAFRWRLPTIDELITLLKPSDIDQFCLDSIFSLGQTGLWSCDTRSKRAAWTVDLEMGFVDSSDLSDLYFVKAVTRI